MNVPKGATYGIVTVWDSVTGRAGMLQHGYLPVFDRSPYVPGIVNFRDTVGFTSGGNWTVAVALGDMDGDGDLDAAFTNYESDSISIFENTSTPGTLSTSSFSFVTNLSTRSRPSFLKIYDIDGDGLLDVLVSNQAASSISVFPNMSSSGTFSFGSRVDINTAAAADDVGFGDFDGDGKPDIVVPNFGGNVISLIRNVSTPGTISSSSFESAFNISTHTAPNKVFVADFNGDGAPDIAVTCGGANKVSVFPNNITSTGSFSSSSFGASVDMSTGSNPFGINGTDIDHDGDVDLIVASLNSRILTVYPNTSTSGSVSFGTSFNLASGNTPYHVDIADMDGDGMQDIFSPNSSSDQSVSVFRNTFVPGSGTISASDFTRTDFNIGSITQGVALGDLDLDGKPDIIATKTHCITLLALPIQFVLGLIFRLPIQPLVVHGRRRIPVWPLLAIRVW
ncbi:MAG: VCBS repeat-containing protein [Chitinophagia bacterium]|nr:VCBS repeat-containing protein [Chitinophagia bacterium]